MDLGACGVHVLATAGHEAVARDWGDPGAVFLKLGAILLLVLLNGFFVAAEFAIVKIRASEIEALGARRSRALDAARRVTSRLDAYLSASQLGITLTSLGLGWLGEAYVMQLLTPFFFLLGDASPTVARAISFPLAFGLITFLHIVLGEQAPKMFAIRKSLATTLFVSVPLHGFYVVFRPAIAFLNSSANLFVRQVLKVDPVGEAERAHSEEELRLILTESARSRGVTPLGRQILLNALDLKRLVVRDIMTPRGDVCYLDLRKEFGENLHLAEESRHTRFPLCEGHLDSTLGIVHIKDLLAMVRSGETDLRGVKREPFFVPELMPLEKLLTAFLARHAHLAVVVDEYGGAVGIVTLDNVLAELVGEIQDEFDGEESEVRRLSDTEFIADGALALHELRDLAGLELESSEVSTIGGYVTHLLGHLPKPGEKVTLGDFAVTVTRSDGRRVQQVHFQRRPPPEAEGDQMRSSTKRPGSNG